MKFFNFRKPPILQPQKPQKPIPKKIMDTKKYNSLKAIVRFAAKVASIIVDTVQKEQSNILSAVLSLAPSIPGLFKDLANAKKEWIELQDEKEWNELVLTFKEAFDIKHDVSELFIENLIDDVLVVLENLFKVWDRVKNYVPSSSNSK